eukprot:5623300-Ditylum_brightwellii.AAC.1
MSSDASDGIVHETYNDDISESNASSEQLSLCGDYTDTPRNMLWSESSEHKDDHIAKNGSIDHKDGTSNAAWSKESQGMYIATDNSSTPADISATSNTNKTGRNNRCE